MRASGSEEVDVQGLDEPVGRCVRGGGEHDLGEQVTSEDPLVEPGDGGADETLALPSELDPIGERGSVDHAGQRGLVPVAGFFGASGVDVVHTADTT